MAFIGPNDILVTETAGGSTPARPCERQAGGYLRVDTPSGAYIGHQETALVNRKMPANTPRMAASVPLIVP